MGGRTKVHLSLWVISVLVIFCQDTEAETEVTSPSPTMSPPSPPPMQAIAIFGADTDKDNLKGKVPWHIMPFKTDKDKYKPYIIYPPPKHLYPQNFGKPYGYVDKDWDPPKKKDDAKHKKKPKELDDIPKSKADKKKTKEDFQSDRNKVMEFLSMPGYPTRCLDGDKKFLDDKSECKRMKKNMAWGGRQPAGGNSYYPPRRPPWQSNSFVGSPFPYFKPPGPFDTPDPSYPNYYPFLQSQDGFTYPYGPNGYINPYVQDGYNAYIDHYSPAGLTYPFPPGTNPFAPIGSPNPYSQYPYGFFPKPYKLPPYGIPYNKYPNPYNRFYANVHTVSPSQEPEEKKQEPAAEPLKDKPEMKDEKPTSTEEPKNITKDLTLKQLPTLPTVLPPVLP